MFIIESTRSEQNKNSTLPLLVIDVISSDSNVSDILRLILGFIVMQSSDSRNSEAIINNVQFVSV